MRRRRVVTDSEVVKHHLEQQEDRDTEERKSDLGEIMDAVELTSFERDLLYRRYYRSQTVREIAAELGLAPTRIHLSITEAEAKIRETTLEKGATDE